MKQIIGTLAITQLSPEFCTDESKAAFGKPSAVYIPANVEELGTVLADATASGTSLTLSAGRTGITGGAAPIDGSVVVSCSELKNILRVEWEGQSPVLICQPGITLAAIDYFLRFPDSHQHGVDGADRLEPGIWWYPPDPTEMSAHLGGSVATNASGARSFAFGPTRNHIAFLNTMFADGGQLSIRRGDYTEKSGFCFSTSRSTLRIPMADYRQVNVKNASGYFCKEGMDLIDLLVGSEGTLGVFSEIGIRLSLRPSIVGGMSFFQSANEAFAFAEFLRIRPDVAAIEYFDAFALELLSLHAESLSLKLGVMPASGSALYWEIIQSSSAPFETMMDDWEEALKKHGSSLDLTWSGFDAEEMVHLKLLRHAIPEIINMKIARIKLQYPSVRKIGTDAALPPAAFGATTRSFLDAIRAEGIDHAVFGHLGDYHLHINMLPKNDVEMNTALKLYGRYMDMAIEKNGTVSAEHGIGKLKKNYLAKMYGESGIAQMKAIKTAVDPGWMLNRGNLFDR